MSFQLRTWVYSEDKPFLTIDVHAYPSRVLWSSHWTATWNVEHEVQCYQKCSCHLIFLRSFTFLMELGQNHMIETTCDQFCLFFNACWLFFFFFYEASWIWKQGFEWTWLCCSFPIFKSVLICITSLIKKNCPNRNNNKKPGLCSQE